MASSVRLRLRVVQVWRGSPLEEQSFPCESGIAVTVGPSGNERFTTPPTALPPGFALLRAQSGGFSLTLAEGMSGTLHIGGKAHPITGGGVMPEVQLSPQDWGIVALDDAGDTAFFFEVHPPPPPLVKPLTIDLYMASALAIALLLIGGGVAIAFFLGWTPSDGEDLSAQTERVAKLILDKDWPKKPEDLKQEKEKKEKIALKMVKQQDTSKRAAGKEGKFGNLNAHGDTRIARGPRDAIAQKVSTTGLLGALKASKGDVTLNRLFSSGDSDVTMALNGMAGVSRSTIGAGTGGLSTRGAGDGGGGKDGGQLLGIGDLKTGGGNGKHAHPGAGQGRVAQEKAVTLTTGDAATDGSLTKDQILKVVMSHKAAIQFCYEKELQRFPQLSGKVVLGWRVELDGTVASPRVASTTLNHPETEGCMVRQLKAWTFPKPQGTVAQVSFPFIFRGQ